MGKLSEENKKYLLGLTYDDMTYTLIEGTFCNHYDPETKKRVPPKISFQDEFDLLPGEYINKEKVHTNVGQYILNLCLYGNCPNIQKVLGYQAKVYTKSQIESTENIMVKAVINGKVDTEEYARYLNNIQWFGFSFNAHVSASFTPGTVKILPDIQKERDRLFKEAGIGTKKSSGPEEAVKITNKLLDKAKDELKNDVGMQLYDSGAKPKFGNAYATMFVSKGPTYNAVTDKFDISKKSFIEGMDVDEIPIYGNSVR